MIGGPASPWRLSGCRGLARCQPSRSQRIRPSTAVIPTLKAVSGRLLATIRYVSRQRSCTSKHQGVPCQPGRRGPKVPTVMTPSGSVAVVAMTIAPLPRRQRDADSRVTASQHRNGLRDHRRETMIGRGPRRHTCPVQPHSSRCRIPSWIADANTVMEHVLIRQPVGG